MAEEGVPPERNGHHAAGGDDAPSPDRDPLRRWLVEHQRSSLEDSVLEACRDVGRDEGQFIEQLQRLSSGPALSRFFESLPAVVVVNEGDEGAGFTCDDAFLVDGVRPGSACELVGVRPGWLLDRFQGEPVARHAGWSALVAAVGAAPRPWRFRFSSPAQQAKREEAKAACDAAIERLGDGRLRVLRTTPFYDADADSLDSAAQGQPTGTLSLGEFTRVLSSTATDGGVAYIQHRLGWSAIEDPSDHAVCFEKVQAQDEPSLAFARAAVAAESDEARRVRVIRRLPCYAAPGAGQRDAELAVGSVIMLEDVAYEEDRQTGSSTMYVRHDQHQRGWSPCLSPEGAHALMPWSAAEHGLGESIALSLLGRTSEDSEEAGGGGSGLATNLVDAVVKAKGGKRQSDPAEVAAAIAALLQQRLRSSADQCPPLVQSVLKGLRLVIEILEVEERIAFEDQQAAAAAVSIER